MYLKLRRIYEHFGEQAQSKKRIEEINELNEAVANKDKEHITEELADVYIMCGQVQAAFDIDLNDIEKIIDQKIERTFERMQSGYYEKGEK